MFLQKINKKKYEKLYTSGESFEKIAEYFDVPVLSVKRYINYKYFMFENIKLKKERQKNIERGL